MKCATIQLLLLYALTTSVISVSGEDACESEERSKKFVEDCYNNPKTQFTLADDASGCQFYYECKDRKLKKQECGKKDKKQLYFENGKCTSTKKCDNICDGKFYELFLRDCPDDNLYVQSSNCQSAFVCKKMTLSLIQCSEPQKEKTAIKLCKQKDKCSPFVGDY